MGGTESQLAVDWERESEAELAVSYGYQSPLMSRMAGTRLTSELLYEQVPIVRAGEAAAERLERATKRMGEKRRGELRRQVDAGERAKELLFEAALPLIRTVAKREWRRRQQWGSQATLEDLIQEATVGFLKGLSSFNLEAVGRSATNYLGQWMLVETRRAAESLDHDLQVGHDAGERFRRIRALRNRLINELGREPTDSEIAAASRDARYIVRPGFVGKAPTDGAARSPGRGVTEAQVEEERTYRNRMGSMSRFGEESVGDEDGGTRSVDPSRVESKALDPSWGGKQDATPEAMYVDTETGEVISSIFVQTMNKMRLPAVQRDIIARRYGIPPHEETSAREIAKQLGIQRDKVSRVLTGFQQEMTRPGGAFHACLAQHSEEDLRDYGLGWAVDSLGPWAGETSVQPPSILRADLSPTREHAVGKGTARSSRVPGARAWYECDFHGRVFSRLYEDPRRVPRQQPCPACGDEAPLIKMAQSG